VTWQELDDGVYHYCAKYHPDLDERIKLIPACKQRRSRTMTSKNGDVWCRDCLAAEMRTIGPRGGRR